MPQNQGDNPTLREVTHFTTGVTDSNRNSHADSSNLSHEQTQGLGIPVLHYYRADELHQRAKIISEIDPNLGELVETPGSGKAILLLWINEEGGIDRTEFQSSTIDARFETAILKQFQSARFQPGEIEKFPVKSLMKIEIELFPQPITP